VDLTDLRPIDGLGARLVGRCAALTIVALVLSSRSGLLWWGLGQALLAIALIQWFVLLHEAGHETLFRNQRLNRAVGHVAGFFALIPFETWRRVHGLHHKWTGWQDLDPTTEALVPRKLGRLERTLARVWWKFWIPIFSVLYRANNFWNLPRVLRVCSGRRHRAGLLPSVAGLAGAYVTLGALLGPLALGRLTGIALVLSFLIEDPLILSQHTHIPQRRSGGRAAIAYPAHEQDVFTRSLAFPRWLGIGVLMNIGAHELHHMYPQVPSYRLNCIDWSGPNTIDWWQWLRKAKAIPGDVFLFQSRDESGVRI
jgi:fatty acid desaturase